MQEEVLSALPSIPTYISDNQKFPDCDVLISIIILQETESYPILGMRLSRVW